MFDDNFCNFDEENLLTNFNNNEIKLYEKVIAKSGETSLYIDSTAYDSRGNLIEGYSALRTKENKKDFSSFWKLFRKIDNKIL